MLVAGLALLGGGATLVAIDLVQQRQAARRVARLAPVIGAGVAGLVLVTSF